MSSEMGCQKNKKMEGLGLGPGLGPGPGPGWDLGSWDTENFKLPKS